MAKPLTKGQRQSEDRYAETYLMSMIRALPRELAAGYVRRSLARYEQAFGAEVASRIRDAAAEQFQTTHGRKK